MGSGLEARVEKQADQLAEKGLTLAQQIENKASLFQSALPSGMEARQLIRDCMSVLRATPRLLQCSPESVMGALMTSAQLGLRPGVLGESYLLPFRNWRKSREEKREIYEAAFVAGYKGLKKLAFQSGLVTRVHAYTVHQRDWFDISYGTSASLEHKPYLGDEHPGEPRGYYSTVAYVSGSPDFHYMSKQEIERHRDKYALQRDSNRKVVGVWVSEFTAMAHKTTFRQLTTWMPLSTDQHPILAAALVADSTVRHDLDPDLDGVITGELVQAAEPLEDEPQGATESS
jgi:recombination protein RecT